VDREEGSVYQIRKEEAKKATKETIFFTMVAKSKNKVFFNDKEYPVFKTDCANVCAKIQYKGNSPSYFVKFGPDGNMLNFKDPMITVKPSIDGKNGWRYMLVNQRCFMHYIDFLRTGNVARYQMARRELV